MAVNIDVVDGVTIIGYFTIVLFLGIWSSCRSKRTSTVGYFLAGQNQHWFTIGCSLFASNIGAPMFIGLAGAAAVNGYSVTIFEWHAVFLLIALGWLFVPVYISSGAYTMPEYLKIRFGGTRLQLLMSSLALLTYIVVKISAEIYAGALFLNRLLGWNLYLCIITILIVTAFYTITGGLTAVLYTDTLQTIIVLVGATVLMIIGLVKVGGMDGLEKNYMGSTANYTTSNFSCGLPRNDSFHIFRNVADGDLPWTGAVFGLTIFGLSVWCSDQIMVQRCLSAKNVSYAKGATLLAALLKITPFFLWIIPGMVSRVLYPDEVACASPESCDAICGNKAGCSNIAYPLMVLRLLPQGLRGLMIAAMLSALMSTLTSIFNSASSMITIDLWKRVRPGASQNEMMVVGRLAVGVCVILSILWIPILQTTQGGQLWLYLQGVMSCVAPPWTVLFLMAIFWKRTTEQGAFWGLIVGISIGLIRFIMEMFFTAPYCGSGDSDTRPIILKAVHFSHFAIIIAVVCLIVTIIISLFTTPRSSLQLKRVTWWTRHEQIDDLADGWKSSASLNDPESKDPCMELTDKGSSNKCFLSNNGASKVNFEKISIDERTFHDTRPWIKRMKSWVCGIDDEKVISFSEDQSIAHRVKISDISEDTFSRNLVNYLAVAISLLTAFLFGYFF